MNANSAFVTFLLIYCFFVVVRLYDCLEIFIKTHDRLDFGWKNMKENQNMNLRGNRENLECGFLDDYMIHDIIRKRPV